jgi:hypothetical protein
VGVSAPVPSSISPPGHSIRVPYLRDSIIVAKVGIRAKHEPLQDACFIVAKAE